jgi:hypothetical protein
MHIQSLGHQRHADDGQETQREDLECRVTVNLQYYLDK